MSWRYRRRTLALVMVVVAGFFVISSCGLEDSSTAESGAAPTTLTTVPTGTRLDAAARNTVFVCDRGIGAVPPLTKLDRPWVSGTTIEIDKMPFVDGAVQWQSEFSMTVTATERHLKGNGLPNHPTGAFPVQPGTAAYEYYAALPAEGYNSAAEIPIAAYDIDITLPRNPQLAKQPRCVLWIFLGVATQTGSAWHVDIAFDSEGHLVDPVAALPTDACWGHPYLQQYHYHGYSWKCFPDQGDPARHSPLFGYAIDGFGVFGPRGEDGQMVTNDDLDECHGHIHEIEWDGERKTMFHYHVNNQYPYSIGCYRGTPVELPHHLQH